MHNTGEILQLCRLCLVKEQVNVPIFEGQGDVKQIFQKISSCLPVKINRSDKLPKNICDGCSEKLDLFYDFWNTSVNSEKQLLEWLGQTPLSAGAGTTIAAKNSKSTDPVQQIKVDVKQEPSDHTDNNESFQADASAVADEDETSFKSESGPPPKRARRAATKRKPITVAPDTDDDDDDDYEPVEPLTKLEDESGNSDNDNEDDSFANAPSTSADDQPGPSGIGKDGVEAPVMKKKRIKKEPGEKKRIKKESDKIRKRVKNPKQEMTCEVCGEILIGKCTYIKHLEGHGEDAENPFKCVLCQKSFKKYYMLNIHKKTHSERWRHMCDICGRTFCDNTTLKRHINTHTENYYSRDTDFRCKICNKTYLQEAYLHKHYLRVHRDEHISYVCDLCGKTLKTKQVLRNHMLIHKGEKVHKCIYCEKTFVRKDILNMHMRIHTGHRPYECKICGKGFTQGTPLKVHLRSHTGEKPFCCNFCGFKFITNSLLTLHMKNVHNIHKDMEAFVFRPLPEQFSDVPTLLSTEEKQFPGVPTLLSTEEKQFSEVRTLLSTEEKQFPEVRTLLSNEEKQFSEVRTLLSNEEKQFSEVRTLHQTEEKQFSEVPTLLSTEEKAE